MSHPRNVLHSFNKPGPAALWMAPSTNGRGTKEVRQYNVFTSRQSLLGRLDILPPPPRRLELAAFTIDMGWWRLGVALGSPFHPHNVSCSVYRSRRSWAWSCLLPYTTRKKKMERIHPVSDDQGDWRPGWLTNFFFFGLRQPSLLTRLRSFCSMSRSEGIRRPR